MIKTLTVWTDDVSNTIEENCHFLLDPNVIVAGCQTDLYYGWVCKTVVVVVVLVDVSN